jgi:hypothetical protein
MEPKIKQKWVKALRSGDYQQGRLRLRSVDEPDCYCCLGVLCDIYLQEQDQDWKLEDANQNRSGSVYLCENSYLTLAEPILKWSGLSSNYPSKLFIDKEEIEVEDLSELLICLTELNDGGSLTFEDIADLIEDHF